MFHPVRLSPGSRDSRLLQVPLLCRAHGGEVCPWPWPAGWGAGLERSQPSLRASPGCGPGTSRAPSWPRGSQRPFLSIQKEGAACREGVREEGQAWRVATLLCPRWSGEQ